jgi:hypothetical protein
MQSMRENDFECLASTGVKSLAHAMFEQANMQYFRRVPQRDPLVRRQGLNQPKIRSRIFARPAFLLHILEFWKNEILMGAPIGCPNRRWSSGLNLR